MSVIRVDSFKGNPAGLAREMAKTIRVQATGERDVYVGYYNLLRRRGGDRFDLRPIRRMRKLDVIVDGKPVMIYDEGLKKEIVKKELVEVIITARQQLSSSWMEEVDPSAGITKPQHFNAVGRGKNRPNTPDPVLPAKKFDIPGMGPGNKVGQANIVDDGQEPGQEAPIPSSAEGLENMMADAGNADQAAASQTIPAEENVI